MSNAIAAPIYTLGLFAVCFSLSAFLRLAIGRPFYINKRKTPPPAPIKKRRRTIYFLTDVKRVPKEEETERVLLKGTLSDEKNASSDTNR